MRFQCSIHEADYHHVFYLYAFPLQDIEKFMINENKRETEVEAVRLENIKLKNKLKKKESQLKSKVPSFLIRYQHSFGHSLPTFIWHSLPTFIWAFITNIHLGIQYQHSFGHSLPIFILAFIHYHHSFQRSPCQIGTLILWHRISKACFVSKINWWGKVEWKRHNASQSESWNWLLLKMYQFSRRLILLSSGGATLSGAWGEIYFGAFLPNNVVGNKKLGSSVSAMGRYI